MSEGPDEGLREDIAAAIYADAEGVDPDERRTVVDAVMAAVLPLLTAERERGRLRWPPGVLTNLAHAYAEWKAATQVADSSAEMSVEERRATRNRQHLAHQRFDAAAEKLLLRRTLDEIDSTLGPLSATDPGSSDG